MSSRSRGRILRRLSVVFGFGLLFAAVPLPGLTFATQSVGATAEVPAAVAMTPQQVAELQAVADEPIGVDRVVAADVDAGTFTAIGFTFDAQPSAPVFARVRDANGVMGKWQELEREDAEGPDPSSSEAGRSGTAPMWVGAVTGYEVSLSASDARGAQVVTVHDELHRSIAASTDVAGAAIAAPFTIGLRSAWNARPPKDTSYATTVKMAVVHHSDSGNNYSPSQVPGILQSIQAFHMDGRGWSDIAYNFVVDKFGGIWEGRGGGIDRPVIGAHAQGFNTNTVGVMVIGDYTQATPTAGSLESVARVIGWKMSLHGSNPSDTVAFTSGGSPKFAAGQVVYLSGVVGHQDTGLTSCPGSIESSLGWIRSRAQEWTSWLRATASPVGSLDSLVGGSASVTARGWATDPSTSVPPNVQLSVAGRSVTVQANRSRPDVQAAYPAYGANTGFEATIGGVPPGKQLACVVANDADGGTPLSFGCARVNVTDPTGLSPTGSIHQAVGMIGGFRITGWTSDADGGGSRVVTVLVDGVATQSATTDPLGGFNITRAGVLAGRRELCVQVANSGPGGQDAIVDCVMVDVAGFPPQGNIDDFIHDGRYIALSGWAFDPESLGSINVEIYLDGRRVSTVATGRFRPDIALAFGMGERSGWGAELWALPNGSHKVCAVADNVGGGADQSLGCRDFVVK